MGWYATAHRECFANKLQKPAVEMAAVTVLLQQKLCFPMKPSHKRHAESPFKLPGEGYRLARYDSTSKSQKYEDKLWILRSLDFPSGVDGWPSHSSYVPHLAIIESHYPSNLRVFAFKAGAWAWGRMDFAFLGSSEMVCSRKKCTPPPSPAASQDCDTCPLLLGELRV